MTLAQYSDDQVEQLSPHALTVDKLDRFLYEIRLQPNWRREADRDADYYDGNQLDHTTLEDMQRLGMAPLIRNLIRPTIDVALGMEAKTRSDWRVQADDDKYQDVAEALSVKLKEAERESRADRACSDAYAGQMKSGVCWVEVSREMDPFRYPYRVTAVSRREMFWDWRSKEPDLSDARYLVRRRWQDVDVLELMFPEQRELINALGFAKANWDTPLTDFPTVMGRSWVIERDVTIPESDWRDSTRKRLCLYEVWYRVWQRGFVVRAPDNRTVEVDLRNPRHAQAIAMGMVEPVPAIFPKVRLSWWIGPHRIADMPTPYRHNNFPYVPFWGYREDLTGIPYGLVRSMISPQDEINARLSKMYWLLSAKRVITDPDQVDDMEELRREVGRPDALIVLSATRRKDGVFKIDDQLQLSQQQFEVMKDAMDAIQRTGGVYQAMLGDKQPGVGSGIAINSLVEQGTTTLAEINDNYRFGRRMVGDMLTELIREDLGSIPMVVNVDSRFGRQKKHVKLNDPVLVQGVQMLNNDIQRSLVKVALEDVPSTPTYRAQQMMMLTEMTKSMPPQLQQFIVPFMLEASEMPHRREVADQVRAALGMAGDVQEMTPLLFKQKVAEAVQAALAQTDAQFKDRELKVREHEAETKRLAATKDEPLIDPNDKVFEHDMQRQELELKRREIDVKEKEAETKRQAVENKIEEVALKTLLDNERAQSIAREQETREREKESQEKAQAEQPSEPKAPAAPVQVIIDRKTEEAALETVIAKTLEAQGEVTTKMMERQSKSTEKVMSAIEAMAESVKALAAAIGEPKKKVSRVVENKDGSFTMESEEVIS